VALVQGGQSVPPPNKAAGGGASVGFGAGDAGIRFGIAQARRAGL
jgi:hypothetical protein